jgi:FtsP/CotA-like multicopper oxidase with cupredoxin domain
VIFIQSIIMSLKKSKRKDNIMKQSKKRLLLMIFILGLFMLLNTSAFAQAVPGGTLDPLTIPKYVIPLVIPPVINNDGTGANNYDIAVRQFNQQILPGGIWNVVNGRADNFPATTVWSYGPAADPAPDASALGLPAGIAPAPNSQFNYPAYTFETMSNVPVNVQWINDLVADPDACKVSPMPLIDPACNYISHLLPLDQTLHWANPPAIGCRDGTNRTDCGTNNPNQYTGPVPIVTHVHGAHVDPHSDGYPEAWWLPAANNIPVGYSTSGTLFDDATGANPGNLGYADYSYRQDQPATTLWYHDHSLGMTRSNVYAGPAGFWLVRGGMYDGAVDGVTGLPAVLPGPAPVAGQGVLSLNIPTDPVRQALREIPIVIQDRSFNADGSLFYPGNRAFFEGLNVQGTAGTPNEQFPGAPELQIPFVPGSDIAPTWNPEAFFNVMVVNGVSWPTLEVAPAKYRFRLLNGCNSRFLNLALKFKHKKKDKNTQRELSFYQIGAEQGFLRNVVEVRTGFATPLPGDGTMPVDRVRAASGQQALLMSLAERADVIVDFSGLKDGTVIRMINTAPDAPFGGFPDVPADPATTGQVMEFVVNSALLQSGDAMTTSPLNLVLNAEPALGTPSVTRQVSLNEMESHVLCVDVDIAGNVVVVPGTPPNCPVPSLPFAPKEALLGQVDLTNPAMPLGIPMKWTETGIGSVHQVTVPSGTVNVWVTENPNVGVTEDWEIYNFTADAHPIHQHLVRFEVINRAAIPGWLPVNPIVQPWENGFKDTVISYPGEITTIRSKFDVAGLYVWHCHIVEHEDNEMMRPYFVGP